MSGVGTETGPGVADGLCDHGAVRDPDERRTDAGTIETGVAASRVPSTFRVVVDEARSAVSALDRNASLYLYGSVATGQAEVGRSDVDLLTIGVPVAESRRISSHLSDRFGDLCRGVAIAPATTTDFDGDHDSAYGNRVFLRHYCLLIAGPDRDRSTAGFPADARAARGFNGDIAQHRDRWRTELDDGIDPELLATRIARKTLLAVAGLVSVHGEVWSTDREFAADRWAQIEPGRRDQLEVLARWTHDALGVTHADVRSTLDHTIDALVDRFAHDIGLWP